MTGDYAAAAVAYERVVAAYTQALGARHVSTLDAKVGWASSLAASGRAAQALPLLEEAAPALAAQLGAEDPSAVFAQRELDYTRQDLGR